MWYILGILVILVSTEAKKVHYHTYYGTVLSNEDIQRHAEANSSFWCTIEIEQPCGLNEGRRVDGSCNNLQHPTIGASHTPYLRLLPADFGDGFEPKPAQSGQEKPLCRQVRTTLLTTGVRPDTTFTHLATHFFVAAAADVSSVHDTVNNLFWKNHCCLPQGKSDPECISIKIPNDDPVHRFSDIRCLNLTRPITYQRTGCLRSGTLPQRINSATPIYDLSFVYGKGLDRVYERGLLKFELEDGRVYPPSTRSYPNICVQNAQPHETRCHNTPQDGMNNVLGVNLVGIWFWRNHNRLASTLGDLNPCWNDDKIFQTARDINIATFLQILYYEFLPLLLGWQNLKNDSVVSENSGFRDMYNPNLLPQQYMESQYILRWIHLMQEGRVKMYDVDGNYLKQIPVVNMTYRTGYLAVDNNFDYMTQGSFRQASAKVDYSIDPDVGDRIFGAMQGASDLASSDLKKGRYGGFPPYIQYVKYCSGRQIRNFEDLTDFIDADKLELLRDLYEHVNDIDLLAGTWMEKPVRGGFAPPTFYCLLVKQFLRNINSDRHWYERPNRPNAFSLSQLLEIRKASISRLLCDVGDKVTRIQRRGFERIGAKNTIVSRKEITGIDLTLWKDGTCSAYKWM